MTWIQAIQSKLPLPRPEHRSNQEIEDDLDAEFAFHLEQSTRDVMNERGLVREDASDVARARFGDVESIKKRCKRIALEERIMLQRVNFVMMLIVALLVIGLGIQVLVTQRYNTLALQAITADLARMKFEAQTPSTANSTASVLVQGDVHKPGWYPIITRDGATFLKDLVERAEPTEASHSVSIRLPNQELGIIVPDAEIPSRVMQPGAIVNVKSRSRLSKSNSAEKPAATDSLPNAPARAGFVYVDGDVPRPGVYNIPSVGQLTLRRLIAAAGGPKGGGDYGVLISGIENNKNITRFESKHFTQDSDQDPDLLPEDRILITSAASKLDRARADALYDFVKQLMSQVSAEHAGDHAYIRGVLDKMEAELPTKYPNNPDLQGLIKEMIAGRRKILEYDERIPAPAPGTAPATSQAPTGAGATAE